MNKRWLIGGGAVVIGVGAYFLLHDSHGASAMTGPKRDGKVAVDIHRNTTVEPRSAEIDLDPFKAKPNPKHIRPKQVWNPNNGSWEMPVVDAFPDPEEAAHEEFVYRSRRMKLTLADDASRCYSGPDLKEEIKIGYTMIVDKEVLRADNVHIVENNISDPAVVKCVLQAVSDTRTLVDQMPDMHEDQEFYMSLHDFYVRNRQEAGTTKKYVPDALTEFDRPAVVPLPPSK